MTNRSLTTKIHSCQGIAVSDEAGLCRAYRPESRFAIVDAPTLGLLSQAFQDCPVELAYPNQSPNGRRAETVNLAAIA
jgi:hypothetical protein